MNDPPKIQSIPTKNIKSVGAYSYWMTTSVTNRMPTATKKYGNIS